MRKTRRPTKAKSESKNVKKPYNVEDHVAPEIIKFLREQEEVLLSFSGGKDSLCTWCVLRDLGIRVLPFYMEIIPGLKFVNNYLEYLEGVFGVEILRVRHAEFYNMMRTYTSQPPHRKHWIDLLNFQKTQYAYITDAVRSHYKAGDLWCIVGTRATDSPARRASFKRNGWAYAEKKLCYPLWDVNKDALVHILKHHRVKVSPDYKMYGLSMDGLHFRYTSHLKKHYPEDYETIKFWFPFVEAEEYRVKWAIKHGVGEVVGSLARDFSQEEKKKESINVSRVKQGTNKKEGKEKRDKKQSRKRKK